MRQIITAMLASAPIALASQTVFSVHDDLLAFPQVRPSPSHICTILIASKYEVIFSDSFISDVEAGLIVEQASSATNDPPQASNTKSIESQHRDNASPSNDHLFDPSHETYELMYLNGEQHLCTIPIVDTPAKN